MRHTLYTLAISLIAASSVIAAASDPIVAARTIGGSGTVTITGMAIDRNGNVVVAGQTTVADISAPIGGAAASGLGKTDGFLACLSPDLRTMLAFTYVGGAEDDRVNGLSIAPNGDIWVTGTTTSKNLPTTPLKGGSGTGTADGFVLRYSSKLDKVIGGRYLAGAAADEALAIACRPDNIAVVCGRTQSKNGLPDPGGHDRTHNGSWDGFVAVIAANAADVEQFSFFGSTGDESFNAVAIDREGGAVVAGITTSNSIETLPKKTVIWIEDGSKDPYYGSGGEWREVGHDAFDKEYNGGTDGLVCRFMGDGTLKFATYVGGRQDDIPTAVLVDADNNPVVVGTTTSDNMPIPEGTTSVLGGKQDAFVIGLNAEGIIQRLGRYLGGDEADAASGVAFALNGNIIITGTTTSTNLTAVGVGSNVSSTGGSDAFIAELSSQDIKFMSLVGWSGDDAPSSVLVDAVGRVVLAGSTTSDLPDGKRTGPMQGFVTQRVFGVLDYRTPEGGSAVCSGTKLNIAWTTNDIPSAVTYSVEISSDAGETWQTVASALKSKAYLWMVPEPPSSGKIWLRVRSSQGHTSGPSAPFGIEGVATITQHPASGTHCYGAAITLESAATGGAAVTFQWRKDGVDIPGATSRSLSITSADATTSGAYTVTASTSCSSATSSAAIIDIAGPPAITSHPQSATVEMGGTIRLSVTAEGSDLTYQWERNDVPLTGATSAALTITSASASDAGVYRCAVTSACGNVTSASAAITIGTTSVRDESTRVGIHPHPLTTTLHVTLEEPLAADAIIMLTDVTGIRVLHSTLLAGMASTSLPVQVTPGLYTLTIQGPSVVHRRTIVVH